MIFVDGHVHIYDCFDVGLLLDSAWENFQAAAGPYGKQGQAPSFVLLLTEGKTENWFIPFVSGFGRDRFQQKRISNRWQAKYSEQGDSVTAFNPDSPDEKIHLVPGRQVVSSEKIEVLALFCRAEIANGLPLHETVNLVRQGGAVPVLPWGVGKWFGKRGVLVESYLRDSLNALLFVGDNGGRPCFWPTPKLFKIAAQNNVGMLPGSDPLPLAEEVKRIGSFGFSVKENAPQSITPVAQLKHLLLAPGD